jgi:8-oxo-dGTP pyrophosphatase MutT (NUDIX family)
VDNALVRAEDELVAVYDAAGQVTGAAPRGIVYGRGLWHAATGVLVRSCDGERVVLHRRTADKLIFPGAWDCWAGGVVGPGEDPADAAVRELAEELGITGVPLEPLPVATFDDGKVRYHAFTYEARWDGPLRPQESEVAWVGWVSVNELVIRLTDPLRWPFAPDGRAAAERWLSAVRRSAAPRSPR